MTINEIAKMAGVSRATVSRYLNNGYVSAEKREVIKRVIDETGYVPSTQAQTLRTKKNNVIGVIIPRLNSDAIGKMISGISSVIAAENYQLILANVANDEKEELKYINTFKDNFVDGIILIGTIFTNKHKKLIDELNIPIVILAQRLEGSSCVYNDDFGGAKALTNLLLSRKKNIAFIGVTDRDKAAGHSRKKGYISALNENNIAFDENYCVQCEFSLESGYEACRELFSRNIKIEGIVCATDNIAAGAMKFLKEKGIKIPEDVMIAGVGDNIIGTVMEPDLTSLHFYYRTSGVEAARLLMNMVKGNEEGAREIKMGYRVVERGSTDL